MTITDEATPTSQQPTTYTFPAVRLDEAKARIAKANRRLERAGIADRFTYDISTQIVERSLEEHGTHDAVEMATLTLDSPAIAFSGWTFVATLDHTAEGVIARTVPGQDLAGWRPAAKQCDHCQSRRGRKETYVVRHDDGRIAQVGRNCLALFLGVRPSGLWALGADPADLESLGTEPEGGWGRGEVLASTLEVIAAALATTDGGRNYRSAAAAVYDNAAPTSAQVREMLWPSPAAERDPRTVAERETLAAAAREYLEDGTASEVHAAARAIEGESDYASNLRVAVAADWTPYRTVGIVASAVAHWAREKEMAAKRRVEQERRAAIAEGFVAPVGAKIENIPATVVMARDFDNDYSYAGGTRTLLLLQTEDNHVVKWFASTQQRYDAGDRVVIGKATVKAHEQYNGTDQTVVVRAKIEPVEAGA